MNIISLFSSNIIAISIEEDTSELNVDDFEIDDSGTAGQKAGGSIDNFILKKYPRIENIILSKFKSFATKMSYSNDFRITTSWITEMKRGDYSQLHNHKNSFYSGVYYFDEYDSNSGNIVFYSPVSDLQDYLVEPKEYTLYNSDSWSIPPEKNLLLFFPSYLKHRIDQNFKNTPRYSIAFNIVPIGEYGRDDSTYNTSWFT